MMKPVFKKTFIKMFTVLPVTIMSLLSLGLGYFLASDYRDVMARFPTFDYLSGRLSVIYALFVFIIIAGLAIWIIVANVSSGLIANELHEGTLRLLVAKPISRKALTLGKITGMLLGAIVYFASSLLLIMGSFALLSGCDKDILTHLLKYTALFFGYGVMMIFLAGSIGSFLSTCFKKKVPGLLILVMIAILAFAIFPIGRMVLSLFNIYDPLHLYYFDINYHFGLIFHEFTKWLGQITTSQSQLNQYSVFTSIYTAVPSDLDITNNFASIAQINTTLNGLIIMLSYFIGACLLYVLTFRRMEKKDIS